MIGDVPKVLLISDAPSTFTPVSLLDTCCNIKLNPETEQYIDAALHALARLRKLSLEIPCYTSASAMMLREEALSTSFIEGFTVDPEYLFLYLDRSYPFAYKTPDEMRHFRKVFGHKWGLAHIPDIAASVECLKAATFISRWPYEISPKMLCQLSSILSMPQYDLIAFPDRTRNEHLQKSTQAPDMDSITVLSKFINSKHINPVIQAAIVLAFISVKTPFMTHNDQLERVLCNLLFMRKDIANEIAPPISYGLAREHRNYHRAKEAFSISATKNDSTTMAEAFNNLALMFARAFLVACDKAIGYAIDCHTLQCEWRQNLRSIRQGGIIDRTLNALLVMPVFSLDGLMNRLSCSEYQAQRAARELTNARILTIKPITRRKHLYYACEVLDILNTFHKNLSPFEILL